jgi:hypothetical protein
VAPASAIVTVVDFRIRTPFEVGPVDLFDRRA